MSKLGLVLLVAVLAAVATQADAQLKLSASNQDTLDEESQNIIKGLLEMIQSLVGSKGDITVMHKVLTNIKHRIEVKIAQQGPLYIHKLAKVLSNVDISEETLEKLKNMITHIAEEDAETLHREKRSKKWKKSKGKGKSNGGYSGGYYRGGGGGCGK